MLVALREWAIRFGGQRSEAAGFVLGRLLMSRNESRQQRVGKKRGAWVVTRAVLLALIAMFVSQLQVACNAGCGDACTCECTRPDGSTYKICRKPPEFDNSCIAACNRTIGNDTCTPT
jgi:hypothetical protein